MSCQIVFTDTAKSDLREIAISIAELAKDKNIAIRYVKELQESTKILETFPESGAIPRDRILKSSGYRFLTHKDYLLFYLYEKAENRVYIMAVFHGKRDYMRVMKKYL
ncbi:MAG: type II toxin-antitoxin system RelE/ParE family toxin [Ruminococcaceae bacterium]|nr:type II toxin-antitoxin system RelE/ParE family toxin [Oscillospiraceae bacterium]